MTQPASIVEAFEPLLPQLAEEEVPLMLAILERIAAEKYRGWAENSADPFEREGLLACAAREDEIADFIESLNADSDTRVPELHSRFPDLLKRYDSVMDGRPRKEQLRIQSEGELGGADYMRQFAAATAGAISARFASLAVCEEANSRFLSELIRN
ncbi:MAG: hypothetical protein PVH91_11220 [Pseudomonadales bacterium]|jgi:hypothetical protein